MSLEDIQKHWDTVDDTPEKLLTPEKIKGMIQQRYRKRLARIILPEILGSLVCLYFVALIFFQFSQLDTPFLQAIGVATMILLLAIPFLNLLPLFKMYRLGQPQASYREELAAFAKQKIWMHRVQRMTLGAGFLLFNAMIIVCTKIYKEEDVTTSKYFWVQAFVVGFVFVYFFTRFVHCYYKRAIGEAEDLLTDLKE